MFTAYVKDQSFVTSTNIRQLTTIFNSNTRGSNSLGTLTVHIDSQGSDIYIQIKINTSYKPNYMNSMSKGFQLEANNILAWGGGCLLW